MKETTANGADVSMPPPKENLIRAVMPGVELVRSDDGGMPTLTGEFAVWDQWTHINSVFEGEFMERFTATSMNKTLRENRDRMRVLFQHGMDPQVGDKPLGPISELKATRTGAHYAVPMLDTAYNRDLIPGLEAGLYGASFRFRVEKEEFVQKPKRSKHNPNGLPERTVTEASVKEFGPVTFPAYAGATAGLRSLTDEFLFGRFIDDPDRLKELIEAHTQSRVEPEPSEVTTPATPEPAFSEAATPTMEVVRVPATKKPEARKETKTMVIEEVRARLDEIRERTEALAGEYGADPFPAEVQDEWDGMKRERLDLQERVADYEDRMEQVRINALDERNVEREQKSVRRGGGPRKRVPENIWDVAEYRNLNNGIDELREAYREGAKQAVEVITFPHQDAKRDEQQEHIDKLLDTIDVDGSLAERILTTSSPMYRRAFGKKMIGKGLTPEEERTLSLTTTAGGYAVPVTLDPTVILTSNGVVNPLRQISRIETITGNTWNGVSSAGITAAYSDEATETSDNAPVLAQPVANVEKAQAFVPFSIEIGQDWGSMESQMARMFQDAKDSLEADKFLTGVGHASHVPEGLLVGGTAVVATTGATQFLVGDLYALTEALPPRFQPRASIIANLKQFNRVRQFDTSGGAALWVQLRDSIPNDLVGYPAYQYSNMVSTLTSGSSMITIGDFSNFLIVDRIGMNVELVPHLFGGTTHYPTGQRGLYAYWRNTTKVLAWQAFRTLKVT
jgi:HK97 family phage major capsid protein